MKSYFALLWLELRTSLALAMEYRADFVTDGFVEVFWTITALVPLFVVFRARPVVAGWTFGEALMVTGFFTLLQGVLEGAINPSMTLVVEQIRKGTFDFILLKPKDAQFLVTTARVLPWRAVNALTAAALFAYGFVELHRAPKIADVAVAALVLVASVAILYALWMLAVSLAFYVVRVDNLTVLFGAVFDAARWPASVFRGFLHVFFTFIVPLAVMTTFPADALLGRASAGEIFGAAFAATCALAVSRAVWTRAISHYTSAGG
ncbi:MAG TPA: ABC-2 family transporter protein [Polyangiaceae bacterium]|jgi:ABC-2 type transport system permease protein